MTKLLKVFLLGFLAFGFVACDEVSEVVDSASKAVDTATKEGKKLAKALSIEQPLLRAEFNDKYDDMILYIQSQDNNTIIEDIIINRGNCSVAKYILDDSMLRAYIELYPDRSSFFSVKTKTKNGEFIIADELITADIFRQLDSDSQSIYIAIFPDKLPYGKKFPVPYFGQNCKTNDIIEVEVIVNGGGSIVYKPKEMLLF